MMVVHKSEGMEIVAKENGWETQLDIDTSKFEQTLELSDMVWTLYAKRGEKKVETLRFPGPETCNRNAFISLETMFSVRFAKLRSLLC